VGFTTDLQRRLTEHFHGEFKATTPRRPFRLIFPVRHSRERRKQGDGGCEYFLLTLCVAATQTVAALRLPCISLTWQRE
jgi:hypothetical protein